MSKQDYDEASERVHRYAQGLIAGHADEVRRLWPLIRQLCPILHKLGSLLANGNVDDYIFKPTRHSYKTAKTYLSALYPSEENFPEPEIESDSLGGIEIEWSHGARVVILGCRPYRNQKDFIYSQNGQHQADEASPLNLKDRLKWLMS